MRIKGERVIVSKNGRITFITLLSGEGGLNLAKTLIAIKITNKHIAGVIINPSS